MNALRLRGGVDAASFAERTGVADDGIADVMRRARERGWLVDDPARIAATALGVTSTMWSGLSCPKSED